MALRKFNFQTPESLAGSLLIAHPGLLDPNFLHSVIFVTAHQKEEGAIGVVINRPTGKTIADLAPSSAPTGLESVPVYAGGPVQSDQILFSAWHWSHDNVLQMQFGIDAAQAARIQTEGRFQLRAFLGFSGWTPGQLENEIDQASWIVQGLTTQILQDHDPEDLWRALVETASNGFGGADWPPPPDDPSDN
jgi:putative transcriptional regulator